MTALYRSELMTMKDIYVAIELQLSFSNLARLKPERT